MLETALTTEPNTCTKGTCLNLDINVCFRLDISGGISCITHILRLDISGGISCIIHILRLDISGWYKLYYSHIKVGY